MRMIRGMRARFGRRPEGGRQRGATIPEYALLLSAIVVGSLAGLTAIQTEAEDELQDRADCVKEIPGSPAAQQCGYQATTTTNTGPTSSGVTAPTVPTTPTTVATTASTVATTASTVATTASTAATTSTTAPTTSTTAATTTTLSTTFSVAITTARTLEGQAGPPACPQNQSVNRWCGQATFATTPSLNTVSITYAFEAWSGANASGTRTINTTGTCSTTAGSCTSTIPMERCSDVSSYRWRVTGATKAGYTWSGAPGPSAWSTINRNTNWSC